jgi:hypothetical protein
MKPPLLKLLLLLTFLPLGVQAQQIDPIQQTLNAQQAEIQRLYLLQRVQSNQRQIEQMQNQLYPQQPAVVVERKPPNLLGVVAGVVLKSVLDNGSFGCAGTYRGTLCGGGYNVNNGGYGGGYWAGGRYYGDRRWW